MPSYLKGSNSGRGRPRAQERSVALGARLPRVAAVRTTSKAKVPRTHTYPIGAEALSVTLGECAGDSTVRFECYPVGLQTEKHAYRVISLELGKPDVPFGASNDALAGGAFSPRCEITVSAVKRELAMKVRQLLREVAIVYYRQHLREHPDAKVGHHYRIDFHFSEAGGEMVGPTLRT